MRSTPANMAYFRNLAPDEPFDTTVAGAVSTDFSLQMSMGIRNFHAATPPCRAPPRALPRPASTAQT